MKRGIATFTLDHGHCPPWLFARMVKLGREMTRTIVDEYGPDEFIKRMADPVWFQALGTVLAFDWNASGLTTVLTGALKEAIRGEESDLGVFIAGGKGKTSRKTPDQIAEWGGRLGLADPYVRNLQYNSKMSAKVDSALIQDGYQIYHHTFFFSRQGAWTVVQQGMNTLSQSARRYHWHSADVRDLVVEPHSAIAAQMKHARTLNLTAFASDPARFTSVELVAAGATNLHRDLEVLDRYRSELVDTLRMRSGEEQLTLLSLARGEFKHYKTELESFSTSPYLKKILAKLAELSPETYEKLLATEGVGPKTMRALALVSEVVYGAKASYTDPARYSFAHGGKDATPYPVDRPTYDRTIYVMRELVAKSRLAAPDKNQAIRRLAASN